MVEGSEQADSARDSSMQFLGRQMEKKKASVFLFPGHVFQLQQMGMEQESGLQRPQL